MNAYHRPDSLDDALALLAEKPLTLAAGCTDLFPATELQELPGAVLYLTGVAGLRGVTTVPDGWRIGVPDQVFTVDEKDGEVGDWVGADHPGWETRSVGEGDRHL